MLDDTESLPPAGLGSGNPLIEWLWREGWEITSLPDLAAGFGRAINAAGLPVSRLRLTLRTLHPQLAGLSHTWSRETDSVEEFWPPLTVMQEDIFRKSPYALLFQGAGAIRRRLDLPDAEIDFPILEDLRMQGATDYVAMPLTFSDGRISAATFATNRPGGFSTGELETLYEMLPVLTRLMEMHALRRTARILLDTYLGRYTGERVLQGLVHRGDGEDIHAVIWFSDLRASTRLADALPRPDFLQLLNGYFDCMAGAVLEQGGEVLKFIGDAVLAIFPIGLLGEVPNQRLESAGRAALAAARDAQNRMDVLNAARRAAGEPELRYGIGLHVGDVTYGNVGAPTRLDFTVIGPACNEASRVATMCKVLERPLIVSAELARLLPDENLMSLGFHGLRGVREPHELFTLPDPPLTSRS